MINIFSFYLINKISLVSTIFVINDKRYFEFQKELVQQKGQSTAKSPLTCNKDALLEYVNAFEPVKAAVSERFDRESALQKPDDSVLEELGNELVGFGKFSTLTRKVLCSSKEPIHFNYIKKFVLVAENVTPGTCLHRLQEYAKSFLKKQKPKGKKYIILNIKYHCIAFVKNYICISLLSSLYKYFFIFTDTQVPSTSSSPQPTAPSLIASSTASDKNVNFRKFSM